MIGAIVGTCGRNDRFELRLFGGERVKVGVFFGVGGINLFESRLCGLDFTHAAFDGLTHGFFGVELRLLWQVTDFDARHRRGFALDFGVHTRHDFEQSGLA